MDTKKCQHCNKSFTKGLNRSNPSWANAKYCSIKCFYVGHKVWNKGRGDYAKAIGIGKWMAGKKHTIKTRIKMSESSKEVVARGEHNFYIDGRTPERKSIRRSIEYRLWREAVFARDNWICQGEGCGKQGCYLEAHHKKSFALYPQLRFAIDNGISLCVTCHAKVDVLRARTLTRKL